jgi:hypothetical protein
MFGESNFIQSLFEIEDVILEIICHLHFRGVMIISRFFPNSEKVLDMIFVIVDLDSSDIACFDFIDCFNKVAVNPVVDKAHYEINNFVLFPYFLFRGFALQQMEHLWCYIQH